MSNRPDFVAVVDFNEFDTDIPTMYLTRSGDVYVELEDGTFQFSSFESGISITGIDSPFLSHFRLARRILFRSQSMPETAWDIQTDRAGTPMMRSYLATLTHNNPVMVEQYPVEYSPDGPVWGTVYNVYPSY